MSYKMNTLNTDVLCGDYFLLPIDQRHDMNTITHYLLKAQEYYADLALPDLDETPFQYWNLDYELRLNHEILYKFIELESGCWNSSWVWANYNYERDFTGNDFKIYYQFVDKFLNAIPKELVDRFDLDDIVDVIMPDENTSISNRGQKADFYHDIFEQIKNDLDEYLI